MWLIMRFILNNSFRSFTFSLSGSNGTSNLSQRLYRIYRLMLWNLSFNLIWLIFQSLYFQAWGTIIFLLSDIHFSLNSALISRTISLFIRTLRAYKTGLYVSYKLITNFFFNIITSDTKIRYVVSINIALWDLNS